MGCCCDGDTTYPPDKPPVPPPACAPFTRAWSIHRFVQNIYTYGGESSVNDSTYATFSSRNFIYPIANYTDGTLTDAANLGYGVFLDTRGTVRSGIAYYERRLYVLVSLRAVEGFGTQIGAQYSLRQLHGINGATLVIAGGYGGLYKFPPLFNFGGATSYSQAWSTVDAHWGLVNQDTGLAAGGFNPTARSLVVNGMTDLAPNVLASGIAVSGTGVGLSAVTSGGPPDYVFSTFSVSLDSLIDEDGADYLLLLFKVPDADVVQKTTPPINQIHLHGPSVWDMTLSTHVTLPLSNRVVPDSLGCIRTITIRTVIEQDASSLVEEDRTRVCTYLSGQNLTKRFRGVDNSTGLGSMETEEWIDLAPDPPDTAEWTQSNADGLDKTTVPTATPAAPGASVQFTGADDNKTVIWNLTAPTLAFDDGTITAEVYCFNTEDDKAADTIQAAIKLGGSFGSDQPLTWGAAEDGYKSAVLATGKSLSDFSGAQLRLKTGTVGLSGGKTFDLIRIKLSGDVGGSSTFDIERTIDVYLTESGGDYFLTFGYKRETDPNDADWYIGRQTTPFVDTVALGDTGRETIGDLIGLSIPFTHDGDDNDNTGNGTEDGTVTFSITDIAI